MKLAKVFVRIQSPVERLLLGEGLRAKTVRGGAWMASGSIAEQSARFARNMLLTRLLAPEAFGTMAIVMSCSSLLSGLTDVGLSAAVIQNPRGSEWQYINASWWLGVGRAIIVYALIFIAAPSVAHFYGIPDLSALLRITLVSTLLESAISPRSILPQREMKFSRWAAITNGGAICGVILTVILSILFRNVWALAIGFCSENAFRLLLSYIICPGLPRLKLDLHAARDLLHFSKGVFGLSLLNLIFSRTDVFVLAKLVSPARLGLYTMAVYLIQTPSNFLMALLSQTLLPAFCRVQAEVERTNGILIEVTSWIIMTGLPAVVVLCLCGRSILTLVYGSRYATAAWVLTLAATVALFNTLNSLITSVLYAGGQPSLHRRAVAAAAITTVVMIYPCCRWFGVIGGQVTAVLAIAVSYALQLMRVRSVLKLAVSHYGKAFGPAIAAAAAVLAGELGAHLLGLTTTPVIDLAVGVGCYLVAYALCAPAFLVRIRQFA